jgi:hypothetical protein
MATKKPLVLGSDGRPEQLQSGDTIGSVETGQVTQTANATLIAGQVVYSEAADTVDKAEANAAGTSIVLGLAMAAITGSTTGQIQCNGILALTTTQWDAVFGTTGGLAFGTTYYLSPSTAGLGTSTCPSTVGQYVVILGEAISTTELNIKIGERILL